VVEERDHVADDVEDGVRRGISERVGVAVTVNGNRARRGRPSGGATRARAPGSHGGGAPPAHLQGPARRREG
jgi:hypothetical protein